MNKSINTMFWSMMAVVDLWLGLAIIVSLFEAAQPWLCGAWNGFSMYYFTLCLECNIMPCLGWACRIAIVVAALKMLMIKK